MINNSQSKAKKVLELFNSHPYEVLDVRSLRQLFEEQHRENISLKAASCIVQRLWKKAAILRTPTQSKSGYLFTFKNEKLLREKYHKHILSYDFENSDPLIKDILMSEFDNLSSESGLRVNEIGNFAFVKKYGQNYFEKDEIKEFLACVFGFLLTDGHIKKNNQLIQFYFRYENDALLFKENFKKYFPEEKLFVEYARFCYRVSLFNVNFANLMNYFGVPIGNKVFQPFTVPDWIYCGSDHLKRAFLSSLFGGEGSAPSHNKWRIQFVISKCEKEVPNLIFFINQIRHMLFHLGISSSNIQLRKQNDKRQFHARFYVKGKENLIKFHKRLCFAYASEKQQVLNDLLRRHSYIN